MTRNRQVAVGCALLIALVFVTFGRSINADFLEWDDDHNVYSNPHLREFNGENLRWMFFDVGRDTRYKALSWLAWSLIHQGFDLHAPAYHAANVTLHAVNACLVLLLLLRFAAAAGVTETVAVRRAALLAALAWGLHPLRVEPVAWVTGLPYHLSLLFLLGALSSYLGLDFSRSVFRQRRYWLALLCHLGAMLSYPMPAGGIVIFAAMNIFPLRRISLAGWRPLFSPATGRVVLELAPLLLISVAMLGVSIYGSHVRMGIFAPPPTLEQFPVFPRCMQAAYVWCYYLWKPVFPIGLSPVYQTFAGFDAAAPKFLLSGLALIGLSVWTIRCRKTHPALLAFWIAHLGVLAPVLGIDVLGHVPADRYSIIHGLLLSIALLWFLVRRRSEEDKQRIQLVTVAVLAILAVLAWRQCGIWKNNRTFFGHHVATLPRSGAKALALFRLGNVELRAGDPQGAVSYYQSARATHPRIPLPELPFRHGEALYQLGRFPEAITQYQLAIQMRPDAAEPWYGLSQSLLAIGQLDAAEQVSLKALQHHPDVSVFHEDLARIRMERSQRRK